MSDALQPHGLQNTRLPCPSQTPRACSNSCPSSGWCHPTISSSVVPFSSCLQSFYQFISFLRNSHTFLFLCMLFDFLKNENRKFYYCSMYLGLPWWLEGKESACNAGELGSIPGLGRSLGEGNGYPLQYSYLENSTDRKPGRLPSTGSQELETTEQLIKQQHPILTTFPPVICFNFSSSCTSWEQRAWYFSPFVALCSTVSRLNQW